MCEGTSSTTRLEDAATVDQVAIRKMLQWCVCAVHNGHLVLVAAVSPYQGASVWWAWAGSREAGRVRSFRKGLAPSALLAIRPQTLPRGAHLLYSPRSPNIASIREEFVVVFKASDSPFAPTTTTSLPEYLRLAFGCTAALSVGCVSTLNTSGSHDSHPRPPLSAYATHNIDNGSLTWRRAGACPARRHGQTGHGDDGEVQVPSEHKAHERPHFAVAVSLVIARA
jgi:hypothetical protein